MPPSYGLSLRIPTAYVMGCLSVLVSGLLFFYIGTPRLNACVGRYDARKNHRHVPQEEIQPLRPTYVTPVGSSQS